MSSLLGEAIVDAKALRDSALKNAESTIIEKYSDEVKKTLEQLLEQEEEDLAGLDLGDPADPALDASLDETAGEEEDVTETDVPLAATDGFAGNEGQNLSDLPKSGENVEVTIDLGALHKGCAIHFGGPQRGGRIGREKWIAGAGRENDDPSLFHVTDCSSADIRLTNGGHGNGG